MDSILFPSSLSSSVIAIVSIRNDFYLMVLLQIGPYQRNVSNELSTVQCFWMSPDDPKQGQNA